MNHENTNGATAAEEIVTKDFLLLFISSVFFMGSLYTLVPILPLYMQQIADANITDVGILMGTMTITSFLLRPFVGRIADRVGRKPLLLVGTSIFIVASILYPFVKSAWFLAPLLAFHGIGIACFHTTSLTYVGDIAPAQKRGKAMTWFQVSFNLGIMLGPLLGLYLKNRFGFTASFLTAALAAAVSLFLVFFISDHKGTIKASDFSCGENGERCDNRPLALICAAAFAGTVTLGTIQAFLPLFAETVNINNFALYFTIEAGLLIILRVVGGNLPDRLGMKRMIIGALMALGVSMFVLAGTDNLAELSISALIMGTGFAFHPPSLSALLVEIYPPKNLGRVFGMYTMAFEAGFVAGAMAIGPIAAALGFRYTFMIVGLVSMAGAVIFAAGYRPLISKQYEAGRQQSKA
ncbi:MAG: MFS transporter [Actinobacteria bacterium]|nr:MFS transporter [Actinomycetota bacterium]